MAAIEIKNLTYFYPDENRPALDQINLSIKEGEFVLVVGGSGSGKSSLVRAMNGLIPDFYGGKIGGAVQLDGESFRSKDRSGVVQKIGMVFQNPESQLVMTNIEQELAFGMENLGLPVELMKRRIMEVSGTLSLYPFLKKSIPQLSGGLKQKVVLASILAMQPEILILDEPTSQLDPVAGEEILTMIRRLNEDNGITVILIEQRLERCFHLADRILVMEQGRIVHNSTDHGETARWAAANNSPFIPPLAKLFAGVGFTRIPLTVKEGRKILKSSFQIQEGRESQKTDTNDNPAIKYNSPLLEVNKLWLNYNDGTEALKNINLTVCPTELLVIMGENGAGKTTLLKSLRGLLSPSRGKIKINDREVSEQPIEALAGLVGYLAQNPNDYLFLPTVREEIVFTLNNLGLENGTRVDSLLEKLALTRYAEANPRDLSTGERQRVALASVLAAGPRLILLDEPTRGLDYEMKAKLGEILLNLQQEGHALLLVTHDVEFAAEYASEIIFMSQGQIVARGSKNAMLSGSTFYSSQVSKLFYSIDNTVVTLNEGKKALQRLMYTKSLSNWSDNKNIGGMISCANRFLSHC